MNAKPDSCQVILSASQRSELADAVQPILAEAGASILHHYESVGSMKVHTKADRTPLTAADLASHEIIVAALQKLTPDFPILSEEANIPDLEERAQWPILWMVDPLDGTREFIDANDQFCINIALIENGQATLGLIHSPVRDVTYLGMLDGGAWRIENGSRSSIKCRSMSNDPSAAPVLISSSRRFTPDMLACEDGLKKHFGGVERLSQGSAIKFCRVSEGQADIYPCFGPTGEWDTAAGQAIVEAGGGAMMSLDYKPFRYNQRSTVLNGGFFLLADKQYDWQPILEAATV